MPDRLAIEAELRAYYDEEADERAQRRLTGRRIEERTRFLSKIDPTHPVLEIGTGPGRDARAFVAVGLAVVGIDLSLEQSRHSRKAGVLQVLASASDLPFRDHSFSTLWCMSTLMHVPNRAIRETLIEVRRVLAPGAVAAIGVWGGPDTEGYDRFTGTERHRFFSRRADDTWRDLLDLVGQIEVYETWGADDEDSWYQWALLRLRR